jgi:hypothetical protein
MAAPWRTALNDWSAAARRASGRTCRDPEPTSAVPSLPPKSSLSETSQSPVADPAAEGTHMLLFTAVDHALSSRPSSGKVAASAATLVSGLAGQLCRPTSTAATMSSCRFAGNWSTELPHRTQHYRQDGAGSRLQCFWRARRSAWHPPAGISPRRLSVPQELRPMSRGLTAGSGAGSRRTGAAGPGYRPPRTSRTVMVALRISGLTSPVPK